MFSVNVAAQIHDAIRTRMIATRVTNYGGYYGDVLYSLGFPHRAGVSTLATLTEVRRLMNADGMEFVFHYADSEEGESNEILEDNPHYETIEIDVRLAGE